MPQSLSIAAFVLGAVLLLIALVSGGFKIFGAEVSGAGGTVARSIAFVIGLILIVYALYNPAGDVSGGTPDKPKPIANDVAPQSRSSTPKAVIDLSGVWRDSRFEAESTVSQQGAAFSFRTKAPDFTSSGQGSLNGVEYHSNYQNFYPNRSVSQGKCSGNVSSDGRTFHATCDDSMFGRFEDDYFRQ